MPLTIANWIVYVLMAYLAIGVLFAVPFILKYVERVDPSALGSTKGFRLVIFPGVLALWPVLLSRVFSSNPDPPVERTAHKR